MQITASALSLNFDDVMASAMFVKQHFGFHEEMSAEGFISLSRPDAGFNLIFLQTGLASFKPIHMRRHGADALLIVLKHRRTRMKVPFTGGCLCGTIRYKCSAEPIVMGNCHCRDCQGGTGSAFA